jgi:2-polyprenyl-3-methyl-5-hydroxy-6-metoxy-1,4-benzoquinol methylase
MEYRIKEIGENLSKFIKQPIVEAIPMKNIKLVKNAKQNSGLKGKDNFKGRDKLEFISCEICGSKKYKLYTVNSGFDLVKCSGCGLIYANPQPTLDYLINFYSTGKLTEESWGKKSAYYKLVDEGQKDTVNFLASQYPKRKLKVLDIGSGLNQYDYMRRKGWSVLGTEISKTFVKYAKKKGWNVVFGDVLDMKFKSKEFDAIAMMAVVEHLKSPKKYLLKCREILKDDGILIIEVPNLHYALKKSTTLPMSEVMHLYYFTPRTIKKLFNKCGYDVIRMESVLKCGSDNKVKNFAMIVWDKFARIIHALTGIHTNLQITVYAKKAKK